MVIIVTMAIEKNLNNQLVCNQTKFIFRAEISLDKSMSVFTPLLWKPLLPWQQRKSLITFTSEIGHIFCTKVPLDSNNSLFTLLLLPIIVTMATEKTLITCLSEIGQSSYLVWMLSGTIAICCLGCCCGNHWSHGNRRSIMPLFPREVSYKYIGQ